MGSYNLSVAATDATKLTIQEARIVIIANDGTENVYFEFNNDVKVDKVEVFLLFDESVPEEESPS